MNKLSEILHNRKDTLSIGGFAMLDNLESNYDCSQSGEDLHELKQELASLRQQHIESKESQERINRIENQISFILNKCDITH